ncbi:isopentenyl-diphosphate Delta-isomerase [Gordonia insulae]|uniref:Isopentenyl-diphosphate Delta-isomerase n=1 Tax=Gordonia insulae TaxID=2420509 RepID=A0A3G8JNC3_9ACTN|nr:isopentenyl-diphosphate Delta-isomerase [Gordonia insulae]AZG46584.1 Isopentenyl-diphosphate Delta-isomerase [Gordonia insulae]
MTDDLVVLIDADRRPRGTAPRRTVHGPDTPLHLAFSCHVVDGEGRILITRRALGKRTWPGVWTNSYCGHPRPGETVEDAVRRYAPRELGFEVYDLQAVLPDFRYRAVDASGTVENEICPVYVARANGHPEPNPDEVMDFVWADIADVWSLAERSPWALSPWFVEQILSLGTGRDPYRLAATRSGRS